MPSPYTYAFKIISTNCSGSNTISGFFDCTGTMRVKNEDNGTEELHAVIGNIKLDQPEMLITSNANKSNNVLMYPNPTTGIFTIETSSTSEQTLKLFDVTGRLVLNKTINGTTDINGSGLNDGIYNVTISGKMVLLIKK